MNKIDVTISMYFEIDNGEEVLYANTNLDFRTEDLGTVNIMDCATLQRENLAELFHVSVENVKIVSRNTYEQNTEEGSD